jgi:LysM repeat protein
VVKIFVWRRKTVRSSVLIGLGLAAVIIAIVLSVFWDQDTPSPEVAQVQESSTVENEKAPKEVTIKNVLPTFDVVRINPDGDAVIAGRATPGAMVAVLDGDVLLGSVKADGRGEWVFLPSKALEPGNRELSLRETNPDGSVMTSKDVVILVVPEPEKKSDGAIALSMSVDGTGPSKALQTPGSEDLVLSIDAVNYDEKGNLSLSGKAPADAAVYLYLDNKFLGNTEANENGLWYLSPTITVDPGVYQLRADQVGPNKKVLNRVTIPFSRAKELVGVPDDRKIVVQPGNSLWRIARRLYGTGYDYAVIYKANKDQIGDPNKIYPGQVFEIPKN